jgi:hypothetical protein
MRGCRHSGTWLIADGFYEWCYQCGAFRTMEKFGPNGVAPNSAWAIPVGKDVNPWDDWRKRTESWRARKAARGVTDVDSGW